MQVWGSDECVKKSEINAKNHRGGRKVAAGTYTGDSITIGDHLKKLDVEMVEIQHQVSYICTSMHMVMMENLLLKKYEEILREKIQSQSDIDQCEVYYQAAGGKNKRRIYGLGSEAKSYYGTNLCDLIITIQISG